MISPLLRSVLIVEDEAGLRLALRTHFLRHGWDATVASGVREATTAMSLRTFDLILSDLHMLDGTGFEVLSQAQVRCPATAMLFLTACDSVPEAVQAVRAGALDYLVKPVSFDLLLDVAERALQQRNAKVTSKKQAGTERGFATDPARAQLPATQAPEPPRELSMSDLERTHLAQTLDRVGGNRTRAAEVLGISVRTLRNKVRQYDLPPRRYA